MKTTEAERHAARFEEQGLAWRLQDDAAQAVALLRELQAASSEELAVVDTEGDGCIWCRLDVFLREEEINA